MAFGVISAKYGYSDGRVITATPTAFGSVDSGLIPTMVKPMTVKLAFTAFLLDAQQSKGQCGEQAGEFTSGISEVDRWSATPKRARHNALIASS